jgi:hypothetical protein
MLLVSDDSLPLVHAQFRYRSVDPFAVQLRLSVGRFQHVSWTFSRDLLIAGTSRPSGIGDVRIRPAEDSVLIELRSTTDAHALLLADRLPIAQFLGHTVSIVPVGSEIEHYDLDAEMIRLGTGGHPQHGHRHRLGPDDRDRKSTIGEEDS